jgi:hypothetical protein
MAVIAASFGVVLALLGPFHSSQGQDSPCPKKAPMTVIDFEAPPPTLEQLWQRADMIVRGRVVMTHPPVLAQRNVVRYNDVETVEVLKDDRQSPGRSTIHVKQYGGTINIGEGVFRTACVMRFFQTGDDVVLFLGRDTRGDGYWVAYSDPGAIWIDRNGIASLPQVPAHSSAFGGAPSIPASTLLQRLKTLGK